MGGQEFEKGDFVLVDGKHALLVEADAAGQGTTVWTVHNFTKAGKLEAAFTELAQQTRTSESTLVVEGGQAANLKPL